MWSVALVYFGIALLVFCLCGWLAERYFYRDSHASAVHAQIAEDTCGEHGLYLCEECFPLDEWGIPHVR